MSMITLEIAGKETNAAAYRIRQIISGGVKPSVRNDVEDIAWHTLQLNLPLNIESYILSDFKIDVFRNK